MRHYLIVAAAILTAVFFQVSPAQGADALNYIVVGPNGTNLDYCEFDVPGTYDIYATLTLETPAKGLEFVLPPGYVDVLELTFDYPVTGDPEAGAYMDFGECLDGSVQLFHLRFVVDSEWDCPGLIRGIGTYDLPAVVGCDDVARGVGPPCSADAPVPVSPPDSAYAVPTSPVVSFDWDIATESACNEGLGVPFFAIQYGTDPGNLDQVVGVGEGHEGTLESLQPDTRYFWRVRVVDGFWEYAGMRVSYSPIRTFVTEGSIPVKTTTWGEIKSILNR